MKPVIPIAGAFVAGLVAATLVGMRHADPVVAPAATAPITTPVTAIHPIPIGPDSASITPAPPSVAKSEARADSVKPKADTVAPLQSNAARVVATFNKLTPQEIAPIALAMSDSTLAPVLMQMGAPRAAAILAALPSARAKALSKMLLVPEGAAKP